MNISRADYDRVIDLKTAELFRASCFLGSRFGGYSADFVAAATNFGRHLGVAYQIYDDLADFFGDEKRIGKTLGTDLASGKVTLPLLVLLDRLPESSRQELVDEIQGRSPSRFAERIRQMTELEVFANVADAVNSTLRLAEDALAPHAAEPPSGLLLRLCDVLRQQVGNLRSPDSS
jgi:octaprenyl-diphosphate synthase